MLFHSFSDVTSNDCSYIVKLLSDLGLGFSCNTKTQLETVLSDKVEPDRILFDYGLKMASHMKFAVNHNVRRMVVENEAELRRCLKAAPSAS